MTTVELVGGAFFLGGALTLFVVLVARTFRNLPHTDGDCDVCRNNESEFTPAADGDISVRIAADTRRFEAAMKRVVQALEKPDP